MTDTAERSSWGFGARAALAEQAIVEAILDADDDAMGTNHAAAYRAFCADHWRLIEAYEPERLGLGGGRVS